MDFSVGDLVFAEISVDYVDGKEKTLWQEIEVIMRLNNPINESRPNVFHNPLLLFHVIRIDSPNGLGLEHVFLNGIAIF